MRILVRRKINNSIVEVDIDERAEKDAICKALFFTKEDYCDNCKGVNCLSWEANKSKSEKDGKTYTYIKRRCFKCGAQSTAGEYVDGGMFWKKFEVFKKDNGNNDLSFLDEPKGVTKKDEIPF